jgi:hypothetical protein|tara:strand:+ start:830 stop:1078 length:249 start_codon:yes stop_codon:yes gene_type:complete
MIDDDDTDWSGQENLEQRRREESSMDNREKVERLNQAIAILKPVLDGDVLLIPLVGYRNSLVETIEREKEKRNSDISSKWFV